PVQAEPRHRHQPFHGSCRRARGILEGSGRGPRTAAMAAFGPVRPAARRALPRWAAGWHRNYSSAALPGQAFPGVLQPAQSAYIANRGCVLLDAEEFSDLQEAQLVVAAEHDDLAVRFAKKCERLLHECDFLVADDRLGRAGIRRHESQAQIHRGLFGPGNILPDIALLACGRAPLLDEAV